MKFKTTNIHKIFIAFIVLLLLTFIACNRRMDVSQFINKENFAKEEVRCEYSPDKQCILRTSFQKVDQFCSEQKLPTEKCDEIKKEVVRKTIEFREEYIEETKKLTEEIKKITGN